MLYPRAARDADLASQTGIAQSGPWRITFDTNPDDCNLNCIMCEEHSPYSDSQRLRRKARLPKRRMDISLIRRVLKELSSIRLREVIPSTMGEPLLYRHIDEVIDLCATHGLKLNLTTNGTFPGRGAKKWAERIVPVASDVKVSLNGARQETQEAIMLGSHWEVTLANIRDFIRVRDRHAAGGGNRCRVTIQVTFMETNYAELPDMVRLAAGMGVDRIKGHHLWVHFREVEHLSMRRNPESVARWNAVVKATGEAVDRFRLPDGRKVVLENIFPLGGDTASEIAPGSACPFLGQEAWISTEGRFDPCCAPDALRRSLGDFGNINERSLLDIWESDTYRYLVKHYDDHILCRTCNMRRPEER